LSAHPPSDCSVAHTVDTGASGVASWVRHHDRAQPWTDEVWAAVERPVDVHLGRHGLEVSMIAAAPEETAMIDFKFIGDRADLAFVEATMDVSHLALFVLDDGVAFYGCALPRPALVGAAPIDITVETVSEWLTRSAQFQLRRFLSPYVADNTSTVKRSF